MNMIYSERKGSIMFDKIIEAICGYSTEKIKISRGLVIAAAAAAFVVGLISGAAAARLALGRKLAACSSSNDDFDADEYVRNLNFGDEE